MAVTSQTEWLANQCNKLKNGTCTTLACLMRGGWRKGEKIHTDVATCIPLEISMELLNKRINYTETPECRIGCSTIHGEGLFAGRDFRVGELVSDYSRSFEMWKRVPYRVIPTLSPIAELAWFVGESEEFARVASSNSSFMRANHACKPNTLWSPQGKTLVAIMPIPVGAEITYDYRLEITPEWMREKRPSWANS